MYALLGILGAAACIYGLVGSIVILRNQERKAGEMDKDASLTQVKHPVLANPIFLLYVVIPVLTIVIAMVWIFITES